MQPTYRTALVEPGQLVLLWVSGRETGPSGGHLRARTYDRCRRRRDGADCAVPADGAVAARSELVGHPGLASMEVLRVPAGSNPSYVTPAQLRVLVEMCPELTS